MISIVLIGTGNVARHLFDTFRLYDKINIVQVVGRNEQALAYFGQYSKTGSNFSNTEPADIYIIAVSDDAIAPVSQLIANVKGVVAHTSGSVPMEALSKHPHKGVIYPLQTFSKERKIDLKNVPLCLESDQKKDLEVLNRLAHLISDHVYGISSKQRKSLHLAAVFVNNFTNHLYQIGKELCEENNLPFEILNPLILETAQKLETLSPCEAQTGPAKRGDLSTLKKQVGQLKNDRLIKIYELFSRSIQMKFSRD
ncbi:DUF2520 domain-containing protein [Flavobacteriaceae bacterium F89]|uniref:DUF2520 domain-containing protein n=1 Tax=Cerina litoralis TaxID=2874477 RepID=A0AAE3EX66_9FLAO|nr:Rossmann-like and DUF2520 domain-containing protein [Cerina litoralis]MCG2461381.1 DUF2520 domain-containing protein [Cerina litoralis]